MDAQRNVVRRRTSKEIQQVMAEFASSGISVSEFCSVRGVSRSTMHRYLRQQREQNQGSRAQPRFLTVELKKERVSSAEDRDKLVVALRSGHKIEVGRGFDAVTLERVLGVLERR